MYLARITKLYGITAYILIILAMAVLAWLQTAHLEMVAPTVVGGHRAAPIAHLALPAEDPYPMLPPMSALARLPPAEVVAEWAKLQQAVQNKCRAKILDETLPLQVRRRYTEINSENSKRRLWVGQMSLAHDANLDECSRRNALENLQGYDAYWNGHWPLPVPVELMLE